jgi:flagella basal body P-ring formation protein FlgA
MMILRFSTPPSATCERAGRVSAMIMLRLALAVLVSFVLIVAALAAGPTLKGDVVVVTDALTLGDLVEGIPPEAAGRPLFRAPAFGQSGTIQARRILEAARALGLSTIETGGRAQVTVTRAGRRIATAEIEAAVKRALETQQGVEARALSINFDGPAPTLMVAPDTQGQVTVEDLAYDRRNRRVSALVSVDPQPSERKASVRIAGVAIEYVEVAVLTRALGRSETAQAADFMVEKRAKDTLPGDVQTDTQTLTGRVARRALQVGSVVRTGDLARPEIVARGDAVTIVYEVPGMTLTLRGRATDGGAQGDIIAVVNPQSKKTLQAQIVAPGKVSVSGPLPGRVAVNAGASPAQP